MGNHPFNVIVVLFWLATMTWLVVAKVLPPLRVGEPPSYQAILDESQRQPTACWSIHVDGQPIGWAASKLVRRKDRITELHSRVYLARLPLDELAPGWLAKVLKPVLGDLGRLDVDKQSQIVVDPLGRLVGFESRVRIAEIRDAIKVSGQVEGSTLRITVRSGDIPTTVESYLPPNALITDELSPQAVLPALRVGQRWTVPLYSPFRPPNSPIEILQAQVERAESITWDGRQDSGKLIVFRSDPGSGPSGDEVRGRMWVRDDGLVVRQEVTVLRSRLVFARLSTDPAERLIEALGENLSGKLTAELQSWLLKPTDNAKP
ncbi:MAG: hypothetical protein WD845_15630 [Pirellulales bacterium]